MNFLIKTLFTEFIDLLKNSNQSIINQNIRDTIKEAYTLHTGKDSRYLEFNLFVSNDCKTIKIINTKTKENELLKYKKILKGTTEYFYFY